MPKKLPSSTTDLILKLHDEGYHNAEIAKRARCSRPFVTTTLQDAGRKRNRVGAIAGRPGLRHLEKLAFQSAQKNARRLRDRLVRIYESASDEAALDAIDALCEVDAAIDRIGRSRSAKRRRIA